MYLSVGIQKTPFLTGTSYRRHTFLDTRRDAQDTRHMDKRGDSCFFDSFFLAPHNQEMQDRVCLPFLLEQALVLMRRHLLGQCIAFVQFAQRLTDQMVMLIVAVISA